MQSAQLGQATASIYSPQQDPVTGVIYAPVSNQLIVYATCKVGGLYAQLGVDNWPAQLQLCGSPPGNGTCQAVKYNASVGTIQPTTVTYSPARNLYTAYYNFTVTPAWDVTQLITHRYFICLYDDTSARRRSATLNPAPSGST